MKINSKNSNGSHLQEARGLVCLPGVPSVPTGFLHLAKGKHMTYKEKLLDPRWQKKRLEIFERDQWKCRNCEDNKSPLVAHHLCYFPKTEPWNHPNEVLLTLCDPCHEKMNLDIPKNIILLSALNDMRKALENTLENDYNNEQSKQLDCILVLLGV